MNILKLLEANTLVDVNIKINTFLNPYSYLLARKNKELFKNFNIYIDGILLVKCLSIAGIKVQRKSFDMTSMARELFEQSEALGSFYFIGTTDEDIHKFISIVKSNYPSINIAGYINGFFKNDIDRCKAIENILVTTPDIVVCGMGTLMQEYFVKELLDKGFKGNAYTCGGFLSQTTEKIDFYPKWIDKYNLRFLYRFYKEKHTRKRLLRDYPIFICVFMYDLFCNKYRNK